MSNEERLLLSGNEAVGRAALDAGVHVGTGYPGTPSTEILETFSELGGHGMWSPNEKVAFEVALGAAFGGGRALVTMKHVGLNVASDPLFTAAYTGVTGALVVAVADDPGMASSQNEQDTRRYAVAAGVPLLEPSDSQEAYDYTQRAVEISERWGTPVLLRLTTRVSHSKSVVRPRVPAGPANQPVFERNVQARVMIPAYARPAHRRLRQRLDAIRQWGEGSDLNLVLEGGSDLGIISSGISAMHVREAAPEARLLKLGLIYPFPMELIGRFVGGVKRCVVIEEGDPVLTDAIRAAGLQVETKDEMYRFGEFDVDRVRRILAGVKTPEAAPPRGKLPQLCPGCPHHIALDTLRRLGCIVAGDIGCYTLGVLPPLEAMDSCVCMGASLGVGLGLRHVLPREQARKVVSVIGDSTFVHSGITGLVDMVYNPPPTGHVLVILDNGTTAMTGFQEHPGTGRNLEHKRSGKVVPEELARSMGVENVAVIDPCADREGFERAVREALESEKLSVIISRRTCLIATKQIREYERQICEAAQAGGDQA